MAKSAALSKIVTALQERPAPADQTWEARRREMEAMQAELRIPDDVTTVPATALGVPVEWISTPESRADRAILYLHGGGYAVGSIATHRYLMQAIARAARSTVLAVDYRLAPENPFPAALDDAISAWEWMLDQGLDPRRCAIGGDSAGGGLTLATLLRLRDTEGELPGAAVCLSPWTDLVSAMAAVETKNDDPMVSTDVLGPMARAYAGEEDAAHPLISPVRSDPAGLPPILIQVGTAEHLLDDSRLYAERAESAGVDVTLEEWEDMIHVFQFFPALAESGAAIGRIGSYLESRLAAVRNGASHS